jgi:hypothetical protein
MSRLNDLLAVDLGLRTGFAVYNTSGHLTSYFNRHFVSLEELEDSIPDILDTKKISCVVVEGDSVVRGIWESAVLPDLPMEAISPKEWRRKILTKSEQQNGPSAKAAARLIARQIMWRHGLTDFLL